MFAFPFGGRPKARSSIFLLLLTCSHLSASPAFAQAKASATANATTPTEAPAPGLEEARLHFSNGVELLQVTPPNYQDAFRQFELAYEKSGHSWKVLGNLGLCALKLERDGDALAFYEKYLSEGGDEIEASERSAIERDLLLVKGNMATLEVSSALEDTSVTVSRKGSSVPAQTYEIPADGATLGLRSGELTLTARAGEQTETWSVIVGPEERRAHAFAFAPEAPAETQVVPPPAATAPEERKSGPSGLRTTGYIVGGVGLLAVVGGVVSGIVAKSAESSAAEKCIGTVCPEDAEADFQSASDTAMLANVLLISGGVLTATGVTLVIVGGSKKKSPESVRLELAPRLSLGSFGLSASGNF